LQLHAVGFDSQRVITQAIVATEGHEIELEDKLCSSLLA
ncbi:MAG: glutamate--cysteine ligase, partial [Nostoc sp.]